MKLRIYNPEDTVPLYSFYDIEVGAHKDFTYYLKNQDEEGMSISRKQLFDIFDRFFKEEF